MQSAVSEKFIHTVFLSWLLRSANSCCDFKDVEFRIEVNVITNVVNRTSFVIHCWEDRTICIINSIGYSDSKSEYFSLTKQNTEILKDCSNHRQCVIRELGREMSDSWHLYVDYKCLERGQKCRHGNSGVHPIEDKTTASPSEQKTVKTDTNSIYVYIVIPIMTVIFAAVFVLYLRWKKIKAAAAKPGKGERNCYEENDQNFGVPGISSEQDSQVLSIYDYCRDSVKSTARGYLHAVPSPSEDPAPHRFVTDFKTTPSTAIGYPYAVSSIPEEPVRDRFVSDFKKAPSTPTGYLHALPSISEESGRDRFMGDCKTTPPRKPCENISVDDVHTNMDKNMHPYTCVTENSSNVNLSPNVVSKLNTRPRAVKLLAHRFEKEGNNTKPL